MRRKEKNLQSREYRRGSQFIERKAAAQRRPLGFQADDRVEIAVQSDGCRRIWTVSHRRKVGSAQL
jgi:hypothetical protein